MTGINTESLRGPTSLLKQWLPGRVESNKPPLLAGMAPKADRFIKGASANVGRPPLPRFGTTAVVANIPPLQAFQKEQACRFFLGAERDPFSRLLADIIGHANGVAGYPKLSPWQLFQRLQGKFNISTEQDVIVLGQYAEAVWWQSREDRVLTPSPRQPAPKPKKKDELGTLPLKSAQADPPHHLEVLSQSSRPIDQFFAGLINGLKERQGELYKTELEILRTRFTSDPARILKLAEVAEQLGLKVDNVQETQARTFKKLGIDGIAKSVSNDLSYRPVKELFSPPTRALLEEVLDGYTTYTQAVRKAFAARADRLSYRQAQVVHQRFIASQEGYEPSLKDISRNLGFVENYGSILETEALKVLGVKKILIYPRPRPVKAAAEESYHSPFQSAREDARRFFMQLAQALSEKQLVLNNNELQVLRTRIGAGKLQKFEQVAEQLGMQDGITRYYFNQAIQKLGCKDALERVKRYIATKGVFLFLQPDELTDLKAALQQYITPQQLKEIRAAYQQQGATLSAEQRALIEARFIRPASPPIAPLRQLAFKQGKSEHELFLIEIVALNKLGISNLPIQLVEVEKPMPEPQPVQDAQLAQTAAPESASPDEELVLDEFEAVDLNEPLPSAFEMYLKEMGAVPLLTAEQEIDLAKQIQAGGKAKASIEKQLYSSLTERAQLERAVMAGEAAREHMILANLRLVFSIARKAATRNGSLNQGIVLDLVQEGNIGLVKAVDKFKYEKGNRFSTYATWWIWSTIKRQYPDLVRSIRLPESFQATLKPILDAKRRLLNRMEQEPTELEIAYEMGLQPDPEALEALVSRYRQTVKRELNTGEVDAIRAKLMDEHVARIRTALQQSQDTVSMDTPIGEEEEGTLADLLDSQATTDNPAMHTILKEQINKVLLRLEELVLLGEIPYRGKSLERDIAIFRFRYGLDDGDVKTGAEVAVDFGTNRENIRLALKRIKDMLKAPAIKDYVYEQLIDFYED